MHFQTTFRGALACLGISIASSTVLAQPELDWFVNVGCEYPNGYSDIMRTALAPNNDIFTVQLFDGANYHPDPANGNTSIPAYGYTTAISKYAWDNTYAWTIPLYFTSVHNYQMEITGITIDASGNLYVCGFTPREFDADPGPGTELVTPLNPGGNYNSFVLKYDASGNFVWKGAFNEAILSNIVLGPNGNLYIAGYGTVNNIDFNPGSGINNGVSFGGEDGFVFELTTDRDFVDLFVFGGTGSERSKQIAFDSNGAMYVAGEFNKITSGQNSQFDPAGAGTVYTCVSNGMNDGYVVKLNANGVFQWSRAFQLQSGMGMFSMNEYALRNMWVNSQDEVVFSAGFQGDFLLNLNGSSEGNGAGGYFITSFDNGGNQLYAKTLATNSPWYENIALTTDDDIVFTTSVAGNFDADPGTGIMNFNMSTYGFGLLFARYDTDMNLLWAEAIEGAFLSRVAANEVNEMLLTYSSEYTSDPDFSINTAQADPANGVCVMAKYFECQPIDESVISNGVVLTAAQSGGIYQWVECLSMTPVPGATSQTFTPTVGGDYACEITLGSCTYLSDCGNSTANLDEQTADAFLIYPNPSSGEFHIQAAPTYSGTIYITDLSGRIVLPSQPIPGTLHLSLPAGQYLVFGESAHGSTCRRIHIRN